MYIPHHSLQDLGIFSDGGAEKLEEQYEIYHFKQIVFSRHKREVAHVNSSMMTAIHTNYVSSSQIKYQKVKWVQKKISPLGKKLLAFDNCLEKENHFSLMVQPLISQSHSRPAPTSRQHILGFVVFEEGGRR